MLKTARVLIFIVLFTIYNLLFALPSASAQTVQPPQNLHTYTQSVMIEVASSLTCLLAGVDPINPAQKCLGVNNGKIGPVDSSGGAIGTMGNLIAMTFTIPVHTADYTRYLAQNFGISKHAYAANNSTSDSNGIGFAGLSPLIPIWTAFRNITYLLFVIVFVAIGLAIMLRVHIDPRTVMTIENQIPKIIIGLILVTFSFAIAGFLIDLMYVGISLSTNVLQTTDSKHLTPELANRIAYSTNPLEAANFLGGTDNKPGGLTNFVSNPAAAIGSFVAPVLDNDQGRFIAGLTFAIIGKITAGPIASGIKTAAGFVGGAIGGILGTFALPGAGTAAGIAAGVSIGTSLGKIISTALPIAGAVIGVERGNDVVAFLASIVAFLIISVAILFALFRVWIALLQSYIFILLDVVFAPFWILAGLIPGSSISFTAWLRDLGANLLAFPATIIILLLGRIMIDSFNETKQAFVPPLIGNPATSAIGSLIGFGIILILPGVVNMIKAAFKAPKFDMASIGAAVGAGTGAFGAGVGSVMEFYRKTPKIDARQGWSGVLGRFRF